MKPLNKPCTNCGNEITNARRLSAEYPACSDECKKKMYRAYSK